TTGAMRALPRALPWRLPRPQLGPWRLQPGRSRGGKAAALARMSGAKCGAVFPSQGPGLRSDIAFEMPQPHAVSALVETPLPAAVSALVKTSQPIAFAHWLASDLFRPGRRKNLSRAQCNADAEG